MKVKRILRFYFSADSLERMIDALIIKCACNSDGGGEQIFGRISILIGEKSELARLWNYVDGVMRDLPEEDKRSLNEYAFMRCRLKDQPTEKYRKVQRAAVKFRRHARRLDGFGRGLRLINYYYFILGREAICRDGSSVTSCL